MTVEHLLRHTSGLTSFDAIVSVGPFYRSPDAMIALASEQGFQFTPGTQWAYSNTAYVVLSRIIEKIEGAPLLKVIDSRIIQPAGLEHTVLRYLGDSVSVVDGHSSNTVVKVVDDYVNAYAAGGIASTAEHILMFWHK